MVANQQSIGLGLRQVHLPELTPAAKPLIHFLELAPENYLQQTKQVHQQLHQIRRHTPIIAHGLNLSIGGIEPLNMALLRKIKAFFAEFNITNYSEHLSFCDDQQGYFYDLLPIPFTEEAVSHISKRIIQVQDFLEMQVAFENSSYYYQLPSELTESQFINAIVESSNCALLLDVNNAYVNSQNHHYDPRQFIKALPTNAIRYLHIAGHWQKTPELIIDSHAANIIEEVWHLLEFTYLTHGLKPTLLERDGNIPSLSEMQYELSRIDQIQLRYK